MDEMIIRPVPIERMTPLLGRDRADRLLATAYRARSLLAGHVVWNVSSLAAGGGVAEMLQTLLPYAKGSGVDVRWTLLGGDSAFFDITKVLHNDLHGYEADTGSLDGRARRRYENALAANAEWLRARVARDDLVLLHDPQTAGLIPALRAVGAVVVWRCHIGGDDRRAGAASWEFLRRYVADADALVFTRDRHVPDWLDRSRLVLIPPSIDPLSAKNRPLGRDQVLEILRRVGLLPRTGTTSTVPTRFPRRDGSIGEVRPHRDVLQAGGPLDPEAPVLVQVSRWDRLKDMSGVLTAFADRLAELDPAHLLLVGPPVDDVTDDPGGAEVLGDCLQAWRHLPASARGRVHIASIPIDDLDENATVINAVQRYATVVAQKSLAEGFGLTATEAMWKGRPVVASAVGGLVDQITDGQDGLLVADPRDLPAFATAVARVLNDRDLAVRLGRMGRIRVEQEYLADRNFARYVELFDRLLARR
jgi:trehalose synthase